MTAQAQEIQKVEYFGIREVVYWVIAALVLGVFIGSSVAFYKDYRFMEIRKAAHILDERLNELQVVRDSIDSDLPKDMLKMIDELSNLQSFTACHDTSVVGQLFPSSVKFETKPRYIVGQSKILLSLRKDTSTGRFEAPEAPVTLHQSGGLWASYDVKLPSLAVAQVCVMFFENESPPTPPKLN